MNRSYFFSFFSFLFLFFSCADLPTRGQLAPATIIGKSSDVFIFVPVKKNVALLTSLFNEDKYMVKALDRTDYLYLSLKVRNGFKKKEDMEELLENVIKEEKKNDINEDIEDTLQDTQINFPHSEMVFTENTLDNGSVDEDKFIDEAIKEDRLQEKAKELEEYDGTIFRSEQQENSYMNDAISYEIEDEDVFDTLSYEICGIGKYPKSIAGFIFSRKDGWKKKKSSLGYVYHQKDGSMHGVPSYSFFSIPTKNVVLFSYNATNACGMENLLDRLIAPRPAPFGVDFELAIQQGNDSRDICIFVANPYFFLSKLVGIDLDLPIENLKIYLTRNTERIKEFYNYTIILEVKNINAGFATRLLLSKLLKTQVKIEENKIIVEKARITKEKLLEIIRKVMFKQGQ